MDTSIADPTGPRTAPRRPKPQPLVRSVAALRAIVVGLTLLSLSGMTAYAGTHVHNSSAPLTPAAAAAVDSSTATATAMAATAVAQTTTGTLTLSPAVATTSAPAVTTTHHS